MLFPAGQREAVYGRYAFGDSRSSEDMGGNRFTALENAAAQMLRLPVYSERSLRTNDAFHGKK